MISALLLSSMITTSEASLLDVIEPPQEEAQPKKKSSQNKKSSKGSSGPSKATKPKSNKSSSQKSKPKPTTSSQRPIAPKKSSSASSPKSLSNSRQSTQTHPQSKRQPKPSVEHRSYQRSTVSTHKVPSTRSQSTRPARPQDSEAEVQRNRSSVPTKRASLSNRSVQSQSSSTRASSNTRAVQPQRSASVHRASSQIQQTRPPQTNASTQSRVDRVRSSGMSISETQKTKPSSSGQNPSAKEEGRQNDEWVQNRPQKQGAAEKTFVPKSSYTPKGWNPDAHRESVNQYPTWHPNYWGAGVFYYTPPSQNVFIEEHNYYGDSVQKYRAPKREYDRRKSLSVGLRGGLLGEQVNSDVATDDISWGAAVGYRVFDPIGLEVSYINRDSEGSTSIASPLEASGHLYLFPWTGVSPYLLAGVAVAEHEGAKNHTQYNLPDDYAYGLQGGVGVEMGIGQHISFNAEGTYTQFKNVEGKSTQFVAGLNYYF